MSRQPPTTYRPSTPNASRPTQLRGLKGLWWEPEQYLGWPALLAEAGYNLLMPCYSFSPPSALTWRQPFGARERDVIGQLVAECAGHDLELCLALHPFIGAQSWRAPWPARLVWEWSINPTWPGRHEYMF